VKFRLIKVKLADIIVSLGEYNLFKNTILAKKETSVKRWLLVPAPFV
jgi:hypothetical protein